MGFKMILAAVLCLATQGAVAQTMDQLSGKSAFVRNHLNSLKRNQAVSAYASTKAYCPTVYWYSSRTVYSNDVKSSFREDIYREMKQAGFSAQAVNHCVENSGYVIENYRLKSHPKNVSEKRVVHAGILMFRKKGEAAISSFPVLAEVYTYDKDTFRVFDGRFKEICSIIDNDPGLNVKCSTFGAFNAHWTSSKGRRTLISSNGAYEVILVTRRTASFAKNLFRKTFGG